MGVPKFYRWISERYPCLSEVVKEHQIPEFDNLYLDMNGIIHNCSHPNDDDVHFRISEEQIFKDIFHYISTLFRIIRPKKLFYMAVDGVAPRAKMNQQRGRRFMSARNAQKLIEVATKKGEVLPEDDRFDSNCITPGTHFMARLHEQLKYFVNMKITTDDLWRGVTVILSGHDVAGEGEHKIMDYIRYQRSSENYDSNTRHCLYGLDADLIMLGLCSHEPHFCLLREEVKFVRPSKHAMNRTVNAEQVTFHLLHLSLLREYLCHEFESLQDKIPFGFNVDKLIDDWVFMGFLVGNDFIPHLPHLHIHDDALPFLYETYKKALPQLDGYINEAGDLNLKRFEQFLTILAEFDRERFGDEFEDMEWLDSKRAFRGETAAEADQPKQLVPFGDSDDPESSSDDLPVPGPVSLSEKVKGAFDPSSEDDSSGTDSPIMTASEALAAGKIGQKEPMKAHMDMDPFDEMEGSPGEWTKVMERVFKQHKRNYYREKMDYENISKEQLHEQAVGYVRAIQWNLHYYYHGCCSWSWFYPHHYAPYLSDIKGFSHLTLQFDIAEPFTPFQQLLAVLPAASRSCLPPAYQDLMISDTSPIKDFYPTDFETDLNGKKNDWEAVVVIPFINEERLVSAINSKRQLLTNEERMRDSHGMHNLYTTSPVDIGVYSSTMPGLPDIHHNRAVCEPTPRNAWLLPKEKVVKGLLSGVKMDLYFPGFPTMKHIPHTVRFENANCKVFQASSKKASMILSISERMDLKAEKLIHDDSDKNCDYLHLLGKYLCGKEIHVDWPFLSLAYVAAVSDESIRWQLNNDGSLVKCDLSVSEETTWKRERDNAKFHYHNRYGIDLPSVPITVQVQRLLGRRYVFEQGNMNIQNQWAETSEPVPLQAIVENINVQSDGFDQPMGLEAAFPPHAVVFVIGSDTQHYGVKGTVRYSKVRDTEKHKQAEGFKNNRIVLLAEVPVEPDFGRVYALQDHIGLRWYPGFVLAKKLDLNPHFLSRITGTVYATEDKLANTSKDSWAEIVSESRSSDKINIGLNLKFSKRNEEVPEYTRKIEGHWNYSEKTFKILKEYIEKFPSVVEYVSRNATANDIYFVGDIWNQEDEAGLKSRVKELRDWLKALPSASVHRQTAGSEMIDQEVIKALENEVDKVRGLQPKITKLACKPSAVYRPCLNKGNTVPDTKADFELFDRVINVREGYAVPLGLRGTVIGIHPGKNEADLRLDVMFDEEFMGATKIRSERQTGYRLPVSAIINKTYAIRRQESIDRNKRRRIENHKEPSRSSEPKFGVPSQRVPPDPISSSYGKPPQALGAPLYAASSDFPFGSNVRQQFPNMALSRDFRMPSNVQMPTSNVGMQSNFRMPQNVTMPSNLQPSNVGISSRFRMPSNVDIQTSNSNVPLGMPPMHFVDGQQFVLMQRPQQLQTQVGPNFHPPIRQFPAPSVPVTVRNIPDMRSPDQPPVGILSKLFPDQRIMQQPDQPVVTQSSEAQQLSSQLKNVLKLDSDKVKKTAETPWEKLVKLCSQAGLPDPKFVNQHSTSDNMHRIVLEYADRSMPSAACTSMEEAKNTVVKAAVRSMERRSPKLSGRRSPDRALYVPPALRQLPSDQPGLPIQQMVPPPQMIRPHQHQGWQQHQQYHPHQHQHQQRQYDRNRRGQRHHPNSSNIPSHEMFVPLQVVKKQEPPKYLASSNDLFASPQQQQQASADISITSHDSSASSSDSNGRHLLAGRGPKKTTPRKSRLAANFGKKTE